MRHMVAIDGTFLKNRYSGILYIVARSNRNKQIYLLAYGIRLIENYASYIWIFLRFKEAYGDRPSLAFIMNRHPSFANAIASVFLKSYHGHY